MPDLELVFLHPLNVSVQVGDIVYFVPTLPVGVDGNPTGTPWESTTTPHMTRDREVVAEIGPVLEIEPWNGTQSVITADYLTANNDQYGLVDETDFIMFSKDNKANLSSLLGYYAKVMVRNDSTSQAEMFSMSADFVESSK
tara:strand:- start:1672 stop:2094 length:423 start_codon:yes stop_codon:yes gene_type:complete